jgi:thymidylate synthase
MIMRSCDVGAGLPFNIASTALFTSILAHVLHEKVDRIIIVTGDTHLYSQHFDSARIQSEREPMALPTLVIKKEAPPSDASVDDVVDWIENLCADDFALDGYQHHPPLTYEMVV